MPTSSPHKRLNPNSIADQRHYITYTQEDFNLLLGSNDQCLPFIIPDSISLWPSLSEPDLHMSSDTPDLANISQMNEMEAKKNVKKGKDTLQPVGPPWTKKEEKQLLEAVSKWGKKWTSFSNEIFLGTRSPKRLRSQWIKRLRKEKKKNFKTNKT